MDINDMKIEDIESHLEKRKAVKPRATPESMAQFFLYRDFVGMDTVDIIELCKDALDWTPEPREWWTSLLVGRIGPGHKWNIFKREETCLGEICDWEFRDFDPALIGKVTP